MSASILPLCTAEVTKMKDLEDLDRLVDGVSLPFFLRISAPNILAV